LSVAHAWRRLGNNTLLLSPRCRFVPMVPVRRVPRTPFSSVYGLAEVRSLSFSVDLNRAVREEIGTADAPATFQTPFPQPFPTAASFPQFPAYSPMSAINSHLRSLHVMRGSLQISNRTAILWC